MVAAIRDVEAALGSGKKAPTPAELTNRDAARRSLVAARAVRKGELFNADNLTAKRPGSGVSPMAYWDWQGRPVLRDLEADEPIGP